MISTGPSGQGSARGDIDCDVLVIGAGAGGLSTAVTAVSGLPAVHIQPPDQDVAPPQTGVFSTTTTFNPW